MSNKSLFEKLFEEVMQDDAEALGIDQEAGAGAGDDMGGSEFGGEEDSVTITLDKETARKLMDVLQGVLGEEEMGGEEEGEGEEGGLGEEEGEEGMGGDEAGEEGDDDDEEGDEAAEAVRTESPQAQYKPFTNKGESATKKSHMKASGIAAVTSGTGEAEKKDQTEGTAKYMPFKHKVDHATGSMEVKSNIKQSGQGKSVFHR